MKNLTSNWNIITKIHSTKAVSYRGLNKSVSRLDSLTKSSGYLPSGVCPRIACVKRQGKKGFTVVGGGFSVIGNFNNLKNALAELGYTGAKMGAVKVNI
jgi:hypothetical protein